MSDFDNQSNTDNKFISNDGIKKFLTDIWKATQNKKSAIKLFEHNLLWIKVFGFILIIAIAIINYKKTKNAGLITSNPGIFVAESTVYALTGVFSFLLLVFLRNNVYSTEKIVIIAIVLFVIFFLLNFLLELSGFYAYAFGTSPYPPYTPNSPAPIAPSPPSPILDNSNTSALSNFLDTLKTGSSWTFLVAFVICIIVVVFSIFFIRDYDPMYKFGQDMPIVRGIIFFFEALLFGSLSAVPIYFMSSNRKDLDPKQTSIEFAIITLKFAGLHSIMQLSGFYNKTFNKEELFYEHLG